MANRLTLTESLTAIANAIRTKLGLSSSTKVNYPDGFVSRIQSMNIGDDCNATASDIRDGKTAIVNNTKITGNIPDLGATTYNTSSSDQEIESGKYLSGKQTIKAVRTENISAGNIKNGVTVKVGDVNNHGRIEDVTGTCKINWYNTYVTKYNTNSGYLDSPGGSLVLEFDKPEFSGMTYAGITKIVLGGITADVIYGITEVTSNKVKVQLGTTNTATSTRAIAVGTVSATMYFDNVDMY